MPHVLASGLIEVVPGLMIWTLIAFGLTFWVLKRYAFGPIQKMIDERREQIRRSLEEAEHARSEARQLLEEHRALMSEARSEAEGILAEARRTVLLESSEAPATNRACCANNRLPASTSSASIARGGKRLAEMSSGLSTHPSIAGQAAPARCMIVHCCAMLSRLFQAQ